MSRTVNRLIFRSYRLIQAMGREEVLGGTKLTEAIDILNDLFSHYSQIQQYLPLYETFDLNISSGKDVYTVGKSTSYDFNRTPITHIDNVFYERDARIYRLNIKSYNLFYIHGRDTSVSSLPAWILNEYFYNYSRFTIFPKPDQNYTFTFRVKQKLTEQTNDTILDGVPDQYYEFLVYALARELAPITDREVSWTDLKEKEYMNLLRKVQSDSLPNLDVHVEAPRFSEYDYYRNYDRLRTT